MPAPLLSGETTGDLLYWSIDLLEWGQGCHADKAALRTWSKEKK